MNLLRQRFPDRLISLRGDLPWPARSPDLSPCDFFLWGYLKSLVYVDRPRTIDHLKNNIRDAIANIPIDMLRRVDENFKKRLNQCMRDGGRHLTDVIFKTV
ncbi:TC3A transposase, partial [Pseudoatta argentina]